MDFLPGAMQGTSTGKLRQTGTLLLHETLVSSREPHPPGRAYALLTYLFGRFHQDESPIANEGVIPSHDPAFQRGIESSVDRGSPSWPVGELGMNRIVSGWERCRRAARMCLPVGVRGRRQATPADGPFLVRENGEPVLGLAVRRALRGEDDRPAAD